MAVASGAARAQITTTAPFEKLPPYANNTPAGVKPRLVPNVNGLTVNMLESGTQGRPLVLLLHGFPNLGYSWFSRDNGNRPTNAPRKRSVDGSEPKR